jgi:hypothetical protein
MWTADSSAVLLQGTSMRAEPRPSVWGQDRLRVTIEGAHLGVQQLVRAQAGTRNHKPLAKRWWGDFALGWDEECSHPR